MLTEYCNKNKHNILLTWILLFKLGNDKCVLLLALAKEEENDSKDLKIR